MWLKDIRLYKTCAVFLCTRLTIYIFQSFFPLYLTDGLDFRKEAIAYFPLIVLISGAVTSLILKYITKAIGCKLTYTLGVLFISSSSVWLFVVNKSSRDTVYGAAWLTGSGISTILVTSMAKTADLIGNDKESGAFVYSAMSFSYKFLTGIIIFVIQHLKPSLTEGTTCNKCELFSKLVQSACPGFFALLGLISFWCFFPSEFECRRLSEYKDAASQTNDYVVCEKDTQCEDMQYKGNTYSNNENIDNEEEYVVNRRDSNLGVISLDSFSMEGMLSISPSSTLFKHFTMSKI